MSSATSPGVESWLRDAPVSEGLSVDMTARLLGALGQAVVAMSPEQITIYWNDAATRLYGWTAAEALGNPIRDLLPPADGWDGTAREVMARVGGGGIWNGEFWVRRKDGTPIPILATDTPVYGASGELVAWIGVSSDLTERIQLEQTQAQLSAIVAASHDAIFSVSMDGIVMSWNGGATDLFGYRPDDIVGRPISTIVPSGRGNEVTEILETIRAGRSEKDLETVRTRADGTEVVVSMSIAPIRDSTGAIVAVSTVARDVTDRVALLDRLERDGHQLRAAQASAQLGSFEIDLVTGERTWSDEMFHIIGLLPGQALTAVEFAQSVHPADRAVVEAFQRGAAKGQERSCTVRFIRPDGTTRSVAIQCAACAPGETVVTGTVLDVTDQMVAEDLLAHRALHDPLTDLPNRTLLSERLERALGLQTKTGVPVGVAFVDLDQFKIVNDSLGHTIGDQVLIAVANRLREAANPDDTVGRFGGDEFIVVRPCCDDVDQLESFAEGLRRSLELPIVIDEREFFLSASVGATLSEPHDTPAGMQRDADTAMYAAKQRGGDRCMLFDDELRQLTQHKLDLANELREALPEDELRLVYQPIIGLGDHEVVGFEALLRWDNPGRGVVSPVDFIPVAEETGLIVPIGHWVLKEALGQLARWRDAGASEELWMSINLSATQLQQPGVVASIASAIDAAGVPASTVHFEITESVLMSNVDQSVLTVHRLHDLGVHISVDDFGTGYSSLSYLKQLPVDTLKIDKSFVSGLGHDLEDRSIAQAIIALADALGLQVLAEGIETATQEATLIELGCVLGQGFLWCRPVPPDEAFTFTC